MQPGDGLHFGKSFDKLNIHNESERKGDKYE